jgi:diguanylate cyclase (GGDEF)-like protein
VLSIRQLGWLQAIELAAFDQMVRLTQAQPPDDRVLVVEITEADFRAQNRFPLSDQVIAQALSQLQNYEPRAIGLDIYRDIPNEPGSVHLAAQLAKPNVVAVTYVGNTPNETIPAPARLQPEQLSFNDLMIDPDGVVRRNLLFLKANQRILRSLAMQLALLYLAPENIAASVTSTGEIQLGQTLFRKLEPTSGGYQTIDAEGYQILLRYRSATASVRRITLQQLLDRQIDPDWIRGKAVLIGTTAPSAKDLFYTPHSAVMPGNRMLPGVLLHAEAVSQLLSAVLDHQPLFGFWDDRTEALWIGGWAIVGSLIAWRIHSWQRLLISTTASLVVLLGLGFSLFLQSAWVPLWAPCLALLLAGSGVFSYRMLHHSFHDSLTGLPNRALFLRHLQAAIRSQQSRLRPQWANLGLAVLFLDLDRFKIVNDNLGHLVGDQLLIKCSQRLKATLPQPNLLARVGGDEFAILLRQVHTIEQVTQIADKLQQSMMLVPFWVNQQEIFTSISIGIACVHRDRRYTADDLLRDAHTALYQAKATRSARPEMFVTGMRVQVMRRLQMETDLRRAIEQQEFELYYQPIVCLLHGKTVGFEALTRWHHPQQGLISPSEFIPVAEETGLIIPLGQWILETACRQLQVWQTQFATGSSLMMSVNLSGQQFAQPDLVEFIEHLLTVTGLAGQSLKLEITETVAMQNVEAAIALLQRLKALDLQLSIDDFGTGYSSLSYLHRFPLNTLKIDRSFVSHMGTNRDDAAIVQTIIGLAHNLGMSVVAEGVETIGQLTTLQAFKCDYGQGFFFSKPLTSEDATALLTASICWLKL